MINAVAEHLKRSLKAILHEPVFSLERSYSHNLRYQVADSRLHSVFAQHGYPLGTAIAIKARTSRKWKLRDDKQVFLVKDLGPHLEVIRERSPRLCRLLECLLYDARTRIQSARWRASQWRQQELWALRKRWLDRPEHLMVNIGAGSWYVQGWKVLEYEGRWYRFAKSFIDYHHDLRSTQPFPFADNSVQVFYSEHVFEHLNDECCKAALREAYRCLKSGGGIRIVVPDADLIYDRFLNADREFFKSWMDRDNASMAEAFRTLIGHARTPLDEPALMDALARLRKEEFLGWCSRDLEYDVERAGEHINWFTFDKLARFLTEAGFRDVCKCEAQKSRFEEIRGAHFDTRPWYSLHVDCVK